MSFSVHIILVNLGTAQKLNFTKFVLHPCENFRKFRWSQSVCSFGRPIVVDHMVGFLMLSITRKWSHRKKIAFSKKMIIWKIWSRITKFWLHPLLMTYPVLSCIPARGPRTRHDEDCSRLTVLSHGSLNPVIFLIHHYVGNLKKSKNIAVRQFGKWNFQTVQINW